MTDPVSDHIRERYGTLRPAQEKRRLPDGRVAPFPLARFLDFLKVLRVQTRDYGLQPLTLLGGQRFVLNEIVKAVGEGVTTFVILKARGIGISTLLLAIDMFWAFDNKGLLGAFVVHEEQARDQFRAQIDVFLDLLPKTHKFEESTNNRIMLRFKKIESQIRYLIAGTKTTTNKLGRSGHLNYLHASEVAFYGSPDDIKALKQSVSDLYAHRLYFYESTANGFNHWEEMCRVAKDSPAQCFIFAPWYFDERYELDEQHPLYLKYMPRGGKTPLSTLERKRVKLVKERYGVEITSGQMAWYRQHLENKCEGDQSQMDQEMPWVEEDAFVSTGSQFFSDQALTDGMREARQHLCSPFIFRLTRRWEEIEIVRASIERCELKIWEKPSEFGRYTLGHDPSYGVGGDNAVISVFRGYADACIQVAEYSSNGAAPDQQAWVLAFLCGLYRNTMPIIELTGPGRSVMQELDKCRERASELPMADNPDLANCLAHMRHFLYRRVDSMGGALAKQFIQTTDLKDNLLSNFKGGIHQGICQVRSLACFEEMRRIVVDEDMLGAAGSFHDDRVIAAALAYYAWDQWLRQGLKGTGMTVEHAAQVEANGGEDRVEGLVRRFLTSQKIIRVGDRVP